MVSSWTQVKKKLFFNISKVLFLFLLIGSGLNVNAQVTISGSISVCAGDTATYVVPAVTGGVYNWTVTNGNIVGPTGTNSISAHWDTAGTGTISVLITDLNNQITTGTINVTIHPKPHPHITWPAYPICPVDTGRDPNGGSIGAGHGPACINVCKNSTITYSTPLHTGSTYQWIVSGAVNLTGQGTHIAVVHWDSSTTGDLTVVETNLWGCIDSDHICIKKVDVPTALFSTQSNVCLNSLTNFTNLSTGATSYQWYFGDGGSSTLFNPTHAYSVAGTYTITLIVYNDCHCSDTCRRTITVDSKPGPEISCPATVCARDTETYTTNAIGCVYNWSVTGGTIIGCSTCSSITIAWGPGMIGRLSLYVTGCGAFCSDTTTVIIPIIPSVATITGPVKVCAGDCEHYSLPFFAGGTYIWSISGAAGGVITMQDCNEADICWPALASPGNDTLFVSYYDTFLRCGGTGMLVIHLRPALALFTNAQACANSTSSVSNYPGINCNWSVSPSGPSFTGNGTPAIVITWGGATGIYTVTAVPLVPNQVCNDSVKVKIQVFAAPPKPVITGDTIICPNNNYGYCATGSNIQWTITGGTPVSGSGNCISVLWGGTGPYIVQAIQQMAAAPNCPSDTATLLVQSALPIPTPNITGPANVCANGNSVFINTVSYPGFATLTWSISPANTGSVISGQGTNTVTVQWGNNAPSSPSITLTVTVCGQTVSKTKSLNLFAAPIPGITVNGFFCAGTTATLSATGGVFIAYQWSGPSFSSNTNPSAPISVQGPYHLTVTDANGCTASIVKQVNHLPGPVASISTSDPKHYCIGQPFTATLYALSNPNYTYNWNTGSNIISTTVSAAGTYWVTVTDQHGCTALSNSITITIDSCNGGPCVPVGTVSFIHPAFYGCNPVSFTNTSVGASSFTWDFGDGLTSNAVNGTHTYAQAGFYLVTLYGYVPNGVGTDSCLLQDTAHVEIPLAPRFKFITGCASDSVCFTDLSTFTAGNNITSWNWTFGDLSSSTLQNPCHKYAVGGTYTVTLTISNGTCSSATASTIVVVSLPVAAFTFSSPNCVNSNIPFADLSTPASINYWSWTFGDAGTSLNQNPNHSYNAPGSYNVLLLVKDTSGCMDTASATVNVVAPNIPGNITAAPDTIVCPKTNVVLTAPTCLSCTYLWSNGGTNISITVSATGLYSVTITDVNGCKAVKSIHVIIKPAPSVAIINYGADKFCLGGNTTLGGFFSVNYLYYWMSNDLANNGSTVSVISVAPTIPGVYYYILAVTDTSTGCADTSLPYYITVNDTPVAPVITVIGPSTVCEGDTITLQATHPDSTVLIHWNTGAVGPILKVTASGCYTAYVVDTNGCDNKATKCVTVNPMPDLCSFWTGCFDTCRPYVIHGPPGNAFYQWLLNGIPISGATQQNYTATLSGAYSLILSSSFGCTDTTGVLNLTLHDCDTCAHLVVDSVYCDGQGNNVFQYHVINNSANTINQMNLIVMSPHLNTLYSPVTTLDTVHPGGTSALHYTTIFNEHAGTHLCFYVHIQQIDSMGVEHFCCNSDSQCITTVPCDTNCCYLHILSDSIWCTGTDSSGLHTYGFKVRVDGCGNLTLQTPSGTITSNTSFTLTPGSTLITGSFTDAPVSSGSLCLTFLLIHGAVNCADTTVCMKLPNCDTSCCYLHILSDSVWCKGVDTAGETIYGFKVRVNGCGSLSLQTGDGTLSGVTNFNLTPGVTVLTGTFIDNPPVTGSFCLTFVLTKGPVICADTTVCMALPQCDSLPVLPECYLQFPDSICTGQSASFLYTGSTNGHTFNWSYPGGSPATATGAGPHTVIYVTAGCFPVTLNITTGAQVSICHDSICVVTPPEATISQTGNTLYAYPASMNYQWYYGSPWVLIPAANNQFYSPVVSDLFCVVVTDNVGCSDTACKDFLFEGIDNLTGDFKWSVVPNPNNGNFELLIQSPLDGKMGFNIVNTMGQIVMRNDFEAKANQEKKIPVSQSFAAGVYFIRLESEKGTAVQKMVIK